MPSRRNFVLDLSNMMLSIVFLAQTKKESTTKTAQNGQEKQDAPETTVKKKEPLLLLALHVASYLDWNLGHLEAGLVGRYSLC